MNHKTMTNAEVYGPHPACKMVESYSHHVARNDRDGLAPPSLAEWLKLPFFPDWVDVGAKFRLTPDGWPRTIKAINVEKRTVAFAVNDDLDIEWPWWRFSSDHPTPLEHILEPEPELMDWVKIGAKFTIPGAICNSGQILTIKMFSESFVVANGLWFKRARFEKRDHPGWRKAVPWTPPALPDWLKEGRWVFDRASGKPAEILKVTARDDGQYAICMSHLSSTGTSTRTESATSGSLTAWLRPITIGDGE